MQGRTANHHAGNTALLRSPPVGAGLVLKDGWSAHPRSIRRAFREKIRRAGRCGRCQLHTWLEIMIGTGIKKTIKRHVVEGIQRMARGIMERVEELLAVLARSFACVRESSTRPQIGSSTCCSGILLKKLGLLKFRATCDMTTASPVLPSRMVREQASGAGTAVVSAW